MTQEQRDRDVETLERLCKEKHKAISEYHDKIERRMDRHTERIDNLEKFQVGTNIEIRELCAQIRDLVIAQERTGKTIWKAAGSLILVLSAFFFWYIQSL